MGYDIYLTLLAGFLGNLGVFHPISLFIGAGVGSGSMMAAATGALAVVFPEDAEQIALFAGAANIMTIIIGTYVLYLFSPFPLQPNSTIILNQFMGRWSKNKETAKRGGISMKQKIGIIVIIGIIALMGNWVGYYDLLTVETACSCLDFASWLIGYVSPHYPRS